ncbi:4-galactosyl-N-acetylglucosaminide 3-alpha-L-fucosyltransferase FUT6-like [Watersipora subatra]|uniref:4-galactosyl-N-acetylglucosaminide 3-alpha-L-fucosyltransferase FUT6-like n=1 Tax=Watersipora subatra TaxID=2589382 RepID=UPI00355BB8E4
MSMRHRSGLLVLMISIFLFIWEMSHYSTGSGQSRIVSLVSYIRTDHHLTNRSTTQGSLQSKADSSNQVSRLEDKEVYALPTSTKLNLEVKLLLAYTKFYGSVLPTYSSEYDKSVVVAASFRDCEYKCKWTTNKNDYSKSDAVVFHLYNNLDNKDFVLSELPTRRNVDQKWVLMIREPPAFYYPAQLKLLNDMFNLTMTFQSTADISIPYGGYWNLTEDRKRRPPMNYLKGRNKMVVWLVSNCITSSRRERYVTDLQKYIDIDVFGACGKPITGKYRPLMAEFAKKYKFYIAFENSDCEDYITEKFWKSLHLGMIPIVRGHRADYKMFAPLHSYIHADSFITPKALAEYLKEVSKSPELFQKHHEWRRLYDADFKQFTFNKNWMCDLCTQVHTSSRKTVDVFQEFSETTKCFTYNEQFGRNRTGESIENIDRL